ncbi:MAG: hypothetical protein ACE362_16535 [Phaeodactylibacter xiamenensis]|uniref:Uncharacterized protein n=1 Tax=Phaeodactylibacter xiamenensis TaxID=1524460 RepID=A0A098S650_9BACT|nr:hypothetical protein [Phaeodactylibacter xiamenensis]KGE86702.1 hypothetical protein IX84_19675 [Phaeodactylibacter xiamenensis]MCR9055164.1 hypothetical protein [bacterium]
MYYQSKSIRSARAIRSKALLFTLLFHIALIGYLTYGADLALTELLPEAMLDFLGMNAPETPDVPVP